jgi:predicted signal transduction protein with EAL and GGDEF domain
MSSSGSAARRRIPLHILLLVAMTWIVALALIGVSFLFCALMLPLIPLFIAVVFGVASLLGVVHDFALSRAYVRPEAAKVPLRQHAAEARS